MGTRRWPRPRRSPSRAGRWPRTATRTRPPLSYQKAVHRLSAIGADQSAAQLWFDLADLLEGVGLTEDALDAYRRAAASSGLRARVSSSTLARS